MSLLVSLLLLNSESSGETTHTNYSPMSSDYFVHPTAIVDPGAQIGAGTKIWHFCHVMSGARIGGSCSLGQNVFVADQVRLGRGVKVQNNVSLYTGVICEEEVFIGPSAVFTNVINPRAGIERKHEYRETLDYVIICRWNISLCSTLEYSLP